jgi:excisionase family DNA binding protein
MNLTSESMLTPGQVAALFNVDVKTVSRWADSGRLQCIKTLGGHRRFRESEVAALLRGGQEA